MRGGFEENPLLSGLADYDKLPLMESVLEIEEAIKRLPLKERLQLVERLERDVSDEWDRQFAKDVATGRLDEAAGKALAEHRAGRSTPFPGDAK